MPLGWSPLNPWITMDGRIRKGTSTTHIFKRPRGDALSSGGTDFRSTFTEPVGSRRSLWFTCRLLSTPFPANMRYARLVALMSSSFSSYQPCGSYGLVHLGPVDSTRSEVWSLAATCAGRKLRWHRQIKIPGYSALTQRRDGRRRAMTRRERRTIFDLNGRMTTGVTRSHPTPTAVRAHDRRTRRGDSRTATLSVAFQSFRRVCPGAMNDRNKPHSLSSANLPGTSRKRRCP
ncbi:hypothetical protein GSI_14500 [Ganoderma sinense ZZ0214-1]|uniref:Uncharacterized protein n=1 Tax=Ganoderma sinense ZZ0214-1 TaxID=1077348 RepID=A0A2G8RNX1_9APHY|nr:hypothetical protein GSI_14500 [Ganoderma sinense ZZ0214-1]